MNNPHNPTGSSIPRYFLPHGRINGSIWFFRNIINCIAFYVVGSVFSSLPDSLNALFFVPIVVFVYLVLITSAKRLHDWNLTGWIAPIVFIPFVPLIFWLIPGNKKPNRYGDQLKGVWTHLFAA